MRLDRCNQESGWIVKDLDEAFGYNTVQCFTAFSDAMSFIRERIIGSNADNDQYNAKGWEVHSVQGNYLLCTIWNYTNNLPQCNMTLSELLSTRKSEIDARETAECDLLRLAELLGLTELSEGQQLRLLDFVYFVRKGKELSNVENTAQLYPLSEETTRRIIATLTATRNFGDFGAKELQTIVDWLLKTIP